MKSALKLPAGEAGRAMDRTRGVAADFEKFAELLTRKHLPLRLTALKRVWNHVRQAEHLSPETLDTLALLAGFQSWKDFQRTLHGDDDGFGNYAE